MQDKSGYLNKVLLRPRFKTIIRPMCRRVYDCVIAFDVEEYTPNTDWSRDCMGQR